MLVRENSFYDTFKEGKLTSNFLKVKDLDREPDLMKGLTRFPGGLQRTAVTHTGNPGGTAFSRKKSDYELFNCNNFNIRYWSWNYRGCWHLEREKTDESVSTFEMKGYNKQRHGLIEHNRSFDLPDLPSS